MMTDKQRSDTPARSSARLRGPWLVAARAVWFAVVGLGLVALVAALPVYYRASHTIVDPQAPFVTGLLADDVRLLEQWGFSLGFYAAYDTATIAVFAAVLNTAAALLFWHRSDDRMAWLISLWLALFGVNGSPLLEPLIGANPAWVLPVRFLQDAVLGFFPILTYMFPNGRFVPRWTRYLALAWLVWIAVSPFTPYTVATAAGASVLWFGVLVPGGMLAGILAQIYRYRRVSSRVERQQTKWVLFGFGVVAIGLVAYALLPSVVPSVNEPTLVRALYLIFAGTFLLALPFCLLPVCIGISVLRYHLWDVDLVIRRTLVYGALTLTLGVLYVGCILLSRVLVAPYLGGSELAIVVSTLLIAALLLPVRQRIQNVIDRRFYRRKYDAERVLQAFALTARDETDLERLTATMLQVVDETMQPEFVGLWLRDPQAHSKTEAARPDSRPPR